jgi:thiamine-phosphate diphosphorylase
MIPLARPAIVLVTTGTASREDDAGWRAALRSASDAAAAGVDVVQIRERNLSDRSLAALVRGVVRETDGSRTAVVVSDRPDIALSARAAGVHLRGDGMSAARVRTLVPPDCLVGRSVHSLAEAHEAAIEGAVDYLFFGTIFRSASKPPGHPIQGTEALATICQSVHVPIIAIGGVTAQNVREVARAGAAGVAAIGLFADAGSDTLGDVMRELREAFAKEAVESHDKSNS